MEKFCVLILFKIYFSLLFYKSEAQHENNTHSNENYLNQFLNFSNNSLCRYHGRFYDRINSAYEEIYIDLTNVNWLANW
jgi:hypothetical protein